MQTIVEFQNVTKMFGSKIALNNVNFTLQTGKITGLLGANGSGKTTMIKLINGLIQPNSGAVLVNGQKPGVESKKIVSYLPDTTYVSEWMSVVDVLGYFQDFYADFDRPRAENLLRTLNIDQKAKYKTLSKGNKEKVQLILTMSRRAWVYVLDEPIGGVDPAARDFILDTILTNYDRNAAILITTHLIHDIERVLDHFAFISEGTIVLQSDAEAARRQYNKSIDELFREVFNVRQII